MTMITTQLQTFPLTQFKYALVKTNFQTVVRIGMMFHNAVEPGEIFQVSVVAIGQRNGAVSSRVISTIEKDPQTNSLHSKYQLQQASNICTTFSYAVSSLSRYVRIELHADDSPCDDKLVFLHQQDHASVTQDLQNI